MKLELSREDRAFRDEMRSFFNTRIPSTTRAKVLRGQALSKAEVVEAVRIMNAAGLAVPHWPVEWGGQDWTGLQRHLWLTEMQLAGVPKPLPFNVTMIGPVIARFGSVEMARRFLPATANLDIWWAQGFSEPDAGSDLASLRTTAVRDGDEFVVNGQKTWTSYAQYADWIFCLVRTDPTVRKQAGISMVLIELETAGVTVRPIPLLDGAHEVNEVFFDNVRIPVTNLVGELNMGWTYAKFLLTNERAGAAPIGLIKRGLERAKHLARDTRQGRTSTANDVLDLRLARLESDVLALELTAIRVASAAGPQGHPAASLLKLRGTELQQRISELVLDIAGEAVLFSPFGSADEERTWDERALPDYLNTRKTSIYGGSNEVQRTLIADGVLGLRS